MLVVDGANLTCADVEAVAEHRDIRVAVAPDALRRADQAWRLVPELTARRQLYGHTTGVGANRDEVVDLAAAHEHGRRLMRSHAGGTGEVMPIDLTRAMLLVRLNQLAAGRSGVHPRLLTALADALTTGAVPRVHRTGAIGTGDLTALADTGLTLAGERPWAIGDLPPVPFDAGDALAFQSSNAATIAEAVLAGQELGRLLRASHAVAAMSFIALDGSPEAYATPVHAARPHPGQVECAADMRRLLGMLGVPKPGSRIQDPYGLRAFPQVQGPALDAHRYLRDVLTIEINASTENPMISVETGDAFHHAHFHTAYVAVALDRLRATVHHVAELSAARLGDLVEPTLTGLPAFLAAGPRGSSGVMILEYVAHDALAQLRQSALPVTIGTAVVSRGLEDHASFATHAARSARHVATAYRHVLACELVAATRALRMRSASLLDLPVRTAFDRADAVLDKDLNDRPLSGDIAGAAAVLDSLAEA
ncbi:MAG TPA: aromatic amino acid ammonia-lyase [Actinophytocola sp.]|uniref:aromatic amino acid ammonia-lyase n=1 Tax=Actinophytocola sp. TaxID=1872138 RepID=UPI002DDD4EEC|nr:aromatic amino acid ammonia-lyase [Actinophytocola sp.]HEV2778596.1 aromatic amino acid ammonia-lyase [Actinophytocola sp.]